MLTSVIIPDSVAEICPGVFKNCTSLTSVAIPDGVTTIGADTLAGCSSLISVTIPDSMTIIPMSNFSGCTSLETVYYGGTKAEWNAIPIGDYNEDLANAEIICTDGVINKHKPETSEPASKPAESTVTPGGSEKAQEILDVTLKNVDSENGIEGAALDELLFGESGWTWDQVEKIEFSSEELFSVQYKDDNGDWVKLGDEAATRAAANGIWNTAWTLDPSEMAKDNKYAKVIAKEGIVDVTAKIYIKKGAEKPSSGSDQAPTGIALAIAPVVLAAGAVIVISKKRK